MEVAPENWMSVGGRYGKAFREFTERVPFVCHGLSLSIGGPSPLDETFLHRLKQFLDQHNIRCYSEHLSYCTDEGHVLLRRARCGDGRNRIHQCSAGTG
jgi:uncharacterized protein (UPF0276 family)